MTFKNFAKSSYFKSHLFAFLMIEHFFSLLECSCKDAIIAYLKYKLVNHLTSA